jgi:hypothetical protein
MRCLCKTAPVWVAALIALGADAQGIRDRTRPDTAPTTTLSESQAVDLTLTLVRAEPTTLQTWVRTAGALDAPGTVLAACLRDPNADLVAIGQRVRVFPPDTKSSVYQATVSRVEARDDCIQVEAMLARPTFERAPRYVMEIVVDRGEYLAIPNEAIIEEGDRQLVYKQHAPGQYMPQEIHTGLKGELYAEVVHGLEPGDLVVTFGSFFIDAEHKLKGTEQDRMSDAPMGDAHLHH